MNLSIRRLVVSSALAKAVLSLALAAAMWPAWKVVRLGVKPTYEELLQLQCRSEPDADTTNPNSTRPLHPIGDRTR